MYDSCVDRHDCRITFCNFLNLYCSVTEHIFGAIPDFDSHLVGLPVYTVMTIIGYL